MRGGAPPSFLVLGPKCSSKAYFAMKGAMQGAGAVQGAGAMEGAGAVQGAGSVKGAGTSGHALRPGRPPGWCKKEPGIASGGQGVRLMRGVLGLYGYNDLGNRDHVFVTSWLHDLGTVSASF